MAAPSSSQGAGGQDDAGGPRCALCGVTPEPNETGLLRQLGSPPVVVTVCADAEACVTRFGER
jgi:hypothetical protein